MSYLGFSNNYFDKIAVLVQGSFTRHIGNIYFENSLKGCFGNLNWPITLEEMKKK